MLLKTIEATRTSTDPHLDNIHFPKTPEELED
jgi:hypothetical protein